MEMSLALGQQVLAAQPFSVLLGAQLTVFSEERTEVLLALQPTFLQQNRFAHGGILSYMADTALTFMAGAALGPAILTAEYKINYIKPARGERLIARASVIAATKRQAVCRCDIFTATGDNEYLCATALGTSRATTGASGEASER
ncbi:MAG TPA: PaaI family thioesterase [Ktedonobacterales bacterium]|nr:PaaI family thioesterase [Ktedonobacterales bacterium]